MKRDEYEMSQQVDTTNYKEKYEQALERAKKGECIENIFPELCESEDRKWRNWLIGHLKGYINQTDDKYAEVCKKAIAWLEKQGEQHSPIDANKMVDEFANKEVKGYGIPSMIEVDAYRKGIEDALEKQGEGKSTIFIPKFRLGDKLVSTKNPRLTYEVLEVGHINELGNPEYKVEIFTDGKAENSHNIHYMECCKVDEWAKLIEYKPADKVEQKFKVGDWIINNDKRLAIPKQILKIEKYGYLHSMGYTSFNTVKTDYHLWAIEDAKDGDVLSFYSEYKGNKMVQVGIIEKYVGKHGGCSNTFKIYVGVNWDNNLQIGEYMGCSDIRPATKEQRDQLEKAMAYAGWEFDFEKKELKKIEQKSAWSEEDEKMRKLLINILNVNHPNGFFKVNEIDDDNMQGIHKDTIVDWLKSIKPNHWRPSQEQLEALKKECIAHSNYQLCRLLEELEKL